jgi:hypothetical protein
VDEHYPKNGQCAEVLGFDGYGATLDGRIVDLRKRRPISQRRARNGSMQVHIGRSTQMVHNLVARAFYGHSVGSGFRVKHLNSDLSDNRADNLVWTGRHRAAGAPQPVVSLSVEREYERVCDERSELAELMQRA